MPNKSELIDLIARVDERTQAIPEIRNELRILNGRISENAMKIAKTTEIAENAQECANDNRGNFNKLMIGILIAFISVILSIGLPMWLS